MALHNTNRMYVLFRDETAWGDGGAAGNEELIPFLDGDYNVALEDPVREQQHVLGDQTTFFAVQDVRNLRGSIKVGLWPHLWNRLLSLALTRTSGEVASISAKVAYPDLETRVHTGLKVNSMTLEGSSGGDLTLTLDMIGRHEETTSEPTYPGTYDIPDVPSMLFKNVRAILSLDSDGAMENAFLADKVNSFSITVNNNLKVGPAVEDRVTPAEDGVAAFLTAGRVSGTWRLSAAFDRASFGTLQRSRLNAQLKIVGAHPGYETYYTVDTGGAAAGSAVSVPLTASPALASVNDYVFFDNAGGTNLPIVGKVTAVDTTGPAYGVTIDVLDDDVAAGDHMFLAGFEIKTSRALVSASTVQHPFDDFLQVEVNAQTFSGGPDPVTFKCRDLTLP